MKTTKSRHRIFAASAIAAAMIAIFLFLARETDDGAPPREEQAVATTAPPLPRAELAAPPELEGAPPPIEDQRRPPPPPSAQPARRTKPRPKLEPKPLLEPELEPQLELEPEPEPELEPKAAEATPAAREAEAVPEPQAEEPKPAAKSTPEEELVSLENAVEIVFTEALAGLRTQSVQLIIDGDERARFESVEALATDRGLSLFHGELPLGRHNLILRVKMTGDARVFRYLNEYTFTLLHHGTLIVQPGTIRLDIETVRKGGLARSWEDRIDLEVHVSGGPGEV